MRGVDPQQSGVFSYIRRSGEYPRIIRCEPSE